MCVFSGLPQSDFMWNLRTNKEVQNIFKKIYQTDNLVCSLDGIVRFFLDNTSTNPKSLASYRSKKS